MRAVPGWNVQRTLDGERVRQFHAMLPDEQDYLNSLRWQIQQALWRLYERVREIKHFSVVS
jgi:hypothetical protein